MTQLNESLKHLDMENQIVPKIGVDLYRSNIGYDNEIITVNFTVKQKPVAEDLAEWMEKGYDWVIDAEASPGEISDGRYLVFVEINRRTNAPTRIVDMLKDLETLTGLKIGDWQVKINDKTGPATPEFIKNNLITNPNEYSNDREKELNEWREAAGIETKKTKTVSDDLLAWQRQAGII